MARITTAGADESFTRLRERFSDPQLLELTSSR
jgi:hypothetical protein